MPMFHAIINGKSKKLTENRINLIIKRIIIILRLITCAMLEYMTE